MISDDGVEAGERDHLTSEDVNALLGFVQAYNPVIVGGQCINIWSQLYYGRNEKLDALGPLTSRDLDFYHNTAAEHALASCLEGGELKMPTGDDHTPSAAIVTGFLHGRRIIVDFMAQVKGVTDTSISNNSITFSDPDDHGAVSITLMHPLDCVRSRLANINTLGRIDEHSVVQGQASLAILDCFIDDQLSLNTNEANRRALNALRELEYIIRDMHCGKRTETDFGDRLDPTAILKKFRNDDRIDVRVRDYQVQGILDRLEQKQSGMARRRDRPAET